MNVWYPINSIQGDDSWELIVCIVILLLHALLTKFCFVVGALLYHKHCSWHLHIFSNNHNTPCCLPQFCTLLGDCKQCPAVLWTWENINSETKWSINHLCVTLHKYVKLIMCMARYREFLNMKVMRNWCLDVSVITTFTVEIILYLYLNISMTEVIL